MIFNRPAILRLVVFLIALAVFARLITCSFTWWDDQDTIHQNHLLNPPTWGTITYYWSNAGEHETMGLYVPVTYTVWAALAKVGHLAHPDAEGISLNPAVFHATNVLIHALTAVVAFQLLLRLLGNGFAAFCGAMLFAVHPVQVETVGWVSGTKDLLCGLLSTGALLMYVRSVQVSGRWPRRWRYLLGMLLFVLAMLAKPTGVVTPLMAAVIAVFLLNRTPRQTVFSLLPWFILMIPCVIWTRKFQPAEWADPLPVWARGGVALDALTFYFVKLIWPANLCIDYGHNPAAILANHTIYFTWTIPVAIASLICWGFFHGRGRKPRSATDKRGSNKKQTGASTPGHEGKSPVVAGALLFLIPLLPVLGFVPFEFQLISTTADHYLYLPMLGVGLLLSRAIIRWKITAWPVLILIAVLAIRSILQEPMWQNSRTLFLHTLAVNPRSNQSLDSLGFLTGRDARRLADAGKTAEARPLFDQSIDWYQKALKEGPTSTPTMYNLALNYQRVGRDDLARKQIQHIVQLQPEISAGLRADPIHLAKLLVEFGDTPGAIAWLDQVIARDPSNLLAMQLRARAQERLNHPTSGPAPGKF